MESRAAAEVPVVEGAAALGVASVGSGELRPSDVRVTGNARGIVSC